MKKNTRVMFIIMALLIVLFMMSRGYSYAKYASNTVWNYYLESKLYGKVTKLYCDIPSEQYGLDFEKFQEFINNNYDEGFNISRGNETEVIFPTIEKYIYDIKYM